MLGGSRLCAVPHALHGQLDIEPSSLSQQLAVLRRAGVVLSFRDNGQVMYALSTPAVADLLAAGRRILREVLTDRDGLLAELRAHHAAGEGGAVRVDRRSAP